MLRFRMMSSAMCLIAFLQVGQARGEGFGASQSTRLTSSTVRALDAIFPVAVSRGDVSASDAGLKALHVSIAENASRTTIGFSLAEASQARRAYSYSSANAAVRIEASAGATNGLVISGLAAKAVVTAYQAWEHGRVRVAYPDALKSGNYTASVWQTLSGREHTLALLVSFVPTIQPPPESGIPCRAFQNFVVVVGTWEVRAEPKIC